MNCVLSWFLCLLICVETGVIVLGSPDLPFFMFFFAGTWHQESKIGMSTGLWVTGLALTASDSAML